MLVIPLKDLHSFLAKPELQQDNPPEELVSQIAYNLRFYANWYPEETKRQFPLARQEMMKTKTEAGPLYMLYEQELAPDSQFFLQWVTTRVGRLVQKINAKASFFVEDVDLIVSLASGWGDRLSKTETEKMHAIFKPLYDLTQIPGFRWGGASFRQVTPIEVRLASMAGVTRVDSKTRYTPAFFQRDPETVFKELRKDYSGWDQCPPAVAREVWNFCVTHYDAFHLRTDYWYFMGRFLEKRPEYISDFLSRQTLWFSKMPESASGSSAADVFLVYDLYSDLMQKNVIPEVNKKDVYLLLLSQKLSPDALRQYKAMDLISLEEGLAVDFFARKIGKMHDFALLDRIGKALFTEYATREGGEQAIALLKRHLHPDVVAKMAISFRLVRLLADHSEEEAVAFLQELNGGRTTAVEVIRNDPLWKEVWGVLVEDPPMEVEYQRALERIPGLLVEAGRVDVVLQFYQKNHPYAPLYNIPDELKPRGRAVSFVSVDSFYDPRQSPHPDSDQPGILSLPKPHWEKSENKSHGVLTSSVAVGKRFGLTTADQTTLYLAPIDASGKGSLPEHIAEAFEAVLEAKKQDPTISVVGMSLGVEVPNVFRSSVNGSPVFKRIQKAAKSLHSAGVVITIAAGNDGEKDHINMLGFVDGVTLVGSLSTKLTSDWQDDRRSEYTTGSDQRNPVRFFAHADPVLAPINAERYVWLEQGGTSSAQPHVAGSVLLLQQINPSLTGQDCLRLLSATAVQTNGDDKVPAIDPVLAAVVAANLPGSSYEGDLLAAFTRHLGYTPALLEQQWPRKFVREVRLSD